MKKPLSRFVELKVMSLVYWIRPPTERTASRWIVSTDAEEHVEQIKFYVDLGFTHLVFHAPGHDQKRFLDLYAEAAGMHGRGAGMSFWSLDTTALGAVMAETFDWTLP